MRGKTWAALAHIRQVRKQQRASNEAAASAIALSYHLSPAQIKTMAETVKAVFDAGAPLAAGAGALWAAIGHPFF
ncbi:MAG TPA: hypothetical protein VHS58_16575 [Acetobacteraceae bacterium]|jgi:hypothetical protein|nr:hypothetical protein [Acetobacteraceae bacterium]